MTVGELLKKLQPLPSDMPIGAPDEGGEICELLTAAATCDGYGRPYFLIFPNGGCPLFDGSSI